jgi:hypothetical protein
MRCIALSLLVSSLSFAQASPGANAAKQAVRTIEDIVRLPPGTDAAKQAAMAIEELAQDSHGLPVEMRSTLRALGASSPGKRAVTIGGALEKLGTPLWESVCGTVDLVQIMAHDTPGVLKTCRLKEHGLLPLHVSDKLASGSLLLSALLLDELSKRDSSDDERALARFVAFYNRTDGAGPFVRP